MVPVDPLRERFVPDDPDAAFRRLKRLEEQALEEGALNTYKAQIGRRAKEMVFEWEYNREAALAGMHPAARAYLLAEWEREKQERIAKANGQSRKGQDW